MALAVALPAGLALLLYLVTLAPTVATGDSGELTTVAANLGIAHPPGYPTFTVLGHLFTLLPIGDVAYRVNLLSAVLDAAAVLLVVVLVARLIQTARAGAGSRDAPPWWAWAAGAISGGALAISTAFWRYSLVAEVFALANLLALALLLVMLEWRRRPNARYLWAAALVTGLALTNQQTIIFTAPALVILLGLGLQDLVSSEAGGWTATTTLRVFGVAIAAGVVGLLPYVYLPLSTSAGAAVWGDPTTIDGFLGMVTRSVYGTFSLTVRDTAGSILEHWWLLGEYLVSAFSPIGIGLAVLGGVWFARRRPGEATALLAWFVMAGPIFVALANPPLTDPVTRGVLERFYLLPSLPVAVLVGVGAWALASWLTSTPAVQARGWQAAGPGVIAASLLGLAVLAVVRFPEVDQSQNRVAETYAGDVLASLPEDAVLLTRSDENYTSLLYAQDVNGARPDVIAIDTELLKLASYVDLIREEHPDIDVPFPRYDGGVRTHLGDLVQNVLGLRPVYLVGDMEEDLTERFDLLDEGLVERVLPNGDAPDPLAVLRADRTVLDRLHPPDRTWPPTTWEAAIAAHYADVAFKTGVALQQLGPQPDAADVEALYREAIRISPTLASAYKNLGLVLQANGGAPSEIIAAWSRYLELQPDDPEAAAIRATIQRLRGSTGS